MLISEKIIFINFDWIYINVKCSKKKSFGFLMNLSKTLNILLVSIPSWRKKVFSPKDKSNSKRIFFSELWSDFRSFSQDIENIVLWSPPTSFSEVLFLFSDIHLEKVEFLLFGEKGPPQFLFGKKLARFLIWP